MGEGAIKVLIVEDEPVVARTVERNLGLVGKGRFECANAKSMASARTYLHQQKVDVILLDLGLPDSEGLDTLDSAVKAAGDIPIIVQTGQYDEQLAEDAIERGAAEFFYKTEADTNALMRSIKYALERAKIQRKLKLKSIVFETSITANTCADSSGLIDTVNQAFLEMWRYDSEDELLGMPISVLFDNPEEAGPVFDALDNNGKWEGELLARRKDGSHFVTKIYATTVHSDSGLFIGYQAACVDITRQKESEDALRKEKARAQKYLDIAGVIIVAMDLNGEVTLINRKGCEVLGYLEKEVIGKNWFDHFIPERIKQASKGLSAKVLDCETNCLPYFESPVLTRKGEERLIAWNETILFDDDGHQCGMLSSGSDITDRKKMEVELGNARKLEAVGQLASGIAHEINTPAQYVGNNTSFLQDAFSDLVSVLGKYDALRQAVQKGKGTKKLIRELDKAVEVADVPYLKEEIPVAIEQSLDGVKRVSEIVMAMKEFSHPGVDEKTPVNINHAIETTLTVSRNEWKYVAEMEKHFDKNIPSVPCHLGEFNQAILNIIVNAAHAIGDAKTKRGGERGLISISTGRVDGFAEIRVQDNGPGIPEKIRHRILDPFFTTKEIGRGTGQGLYISRNIIVDKHDGRLDFETEEGVGTTFIIQLPLNLEETAEA